MPSWRRHYPSASSYHVPERRSVVASLTLDFSSVIWRRRVVARKRRSSRSAAVLNRTSCQMTCSVKITNINLLHRHGLRGHHVPLSLAAAVSQKTEVQPLRPVGGHNPSRVQSRPPKEGMMVLHAKHLGLQGAVSRSAQRAVMRAQNMAAQQR